MLIAANHVFPHDCRRKRPARKRRSEAGKLERIKQLVIRYDRGGHLGPCRALVNDLTRLLRG